MYRHETDTVEMLRKRRVWRRRKALLTEIATAVLSAIALTGILVTALIPWMA